MYHFTLIELQPLPPGAKDTTRANIQGPKYSYEP